MADDEVGAADSSRPPPQQRQQQQQAALQRSIAALIVRYKAAADAPKKTNARSKGKGVAKKQLRAGNGASIGDIELVQVTDDTSPNGKPSKAKLKEMADNIKADTYVDYVEPNYLLSTSQAVTNDPYYASLWGMLETDAGANAKGAWAAGYTNCSGVVVGVVDTGVQISHPDLVDAIWTNPGEIPNNGIDDDNNGLIDDVNGWDFRGDDKTPYDDIYDDHGTHIAGTIGARGNNNVGVVGVCQAGVKVIPAKFMGSSARTGTVADAVAALYYLLDLKNRYDLNLVATQNSWGGGGFSQTLFDAVSAHNAAGVLFVAAAGNSALDVDATPNYPSGYSLPNIISVGAHAQNGALSSFSNFGATTVDLFAPGSSIVSTTPTSTVGTMQGTSMAAPHVTGAIALYASGYLRRYGSLPTAAAIKSLVMSSGVSSSAYSGKAVSGARLNIANMLATLPALYSPSPSPSPQPPPSPSPSPSPAAASPSPSPPPAAPSPSPVVAQPPTLPPALPPGLPPVLPPTAPPAEPTDPRPRMRAVLAVTVYYDGRKDRRWFYCHAKIYAEAVETGTSVSGFAVEGAWSVSPDHDGFTDALGEMTLPVSGELGPDHTRGVTNSPWIPVKEALAAQQPAWYPAGTYPGTRCVFTLTSLTHPDYVLDPAVSTNMAESDLL
ncbi:peptidase S8/S53 domain-containing protein [Scenedesmus sp. NREL 46B-D3]|nr:peptidase S8/S53 domain-containing protein [Scenedesmus sp. NREL 46B-D3]